MKCDLEQFELSELDSRFDVILLEPPLKEYQRAQGAVFDKYWDWDEVSTPIIAADNKSFSQLSEKIRLILLVNHLPEEDSHKICLI